VLLSNKRGKDYRQAGMTERGFTLVEVMIAMVVSLLVFFALMQTALVSIDANMKNNLRDEAANIAAMRMEQARNLRFTASADSLVDDAAAIPAGDLPSCPTTPAVFVNGEVVKRNFRNITDFIFCTNRDVTVIDSNTKRVTIRVGWRWRNEDYNHNISTIVRIQSG
jgi:type IV pilus assembly protein PilV